MPEWLALSAIRGGLARGLKWLGGLNIYELGCLALALFALVQHFQIVAAHRHSRKVETQLAQAITQLRTISTKRNEQQVVTRDRIVTVIKTLKDADERAKVVEAAPLPGQCKSPPEVLGADL